MKLKKYIILTLLVICSLNLSAQTLRSIYFSDNIALRHELNAALTPKSGYVSIPVLGNISFGSQTNLGVSKFLYPQEDGTLATFMSPNIDSEKFLKSLTNENPLIANVKLSLLSVGFNGFGGFNTIGLNVNVNTVNTIPYDIFRFMKTGMSEEGVNRFDLSNLRHTSIAYSELAFGHSRQIDERLRVGAKFKVLLGIAYNELSFDQLELSMSGDIIEGHSAGSIFTSGIIPSVNENNELSGIDDINIGVNGFGLGIDLGASYKVQDDITVSASLNDLGFISWSGKGYASKADISFEGMTDLDILGNSDDSSDANDNMMDQLTDDVSNLVSFIENKSGVSKAKSANTTLNLAGEYDLLNDKISIGALYTCQLSGYAWHDFMVNATLKPTNWFNVAANCSVSNFGFSYGGLVSFNSFFVGCNVMSLKFTPQLLPVGPLTLQANFGWSILFGKEAQ